MINRWNQKTLDEAFFVYRLPSVRRYEILRIVAARMVRQVRNEDSVGRLGVMSLS